MVGDDVRSALFLEVHKAIEVAVTSLVENIAEGGATGIAYPPNGGLKSEEVEALRKIEMTAPLASALRKLTADAAASSILQLFALFDGVGDPEGFSGDWFGVRLSLAGEDAEDSRLHDEFFETYWKWRERRADPGWKLDNL